MRIRDWSSDVCSSDLHIGASRRHQLVGGVGLPALELLDRQRPLKARHMIGHPAAERRLVKGETRPNRGGAFILLLCIPTHWAFAFAWSRLIFLASDHLWTDRKSVVEGKSVSVRVDLGGRRIIKKKTSIHKKY